MSEEEITIKNISNPPEKVRLMYEATIKLLKEKKELSNIKVLDITREAGIGKGTAYEYFSSKNEIVANAVVYEYSNKIQDLVEHTFKHSSFKERLYSVMEWIYDNRDYNMLFIGMLKMVAKEKCSKNECIANEKLKEDVIKYIKSKVTRLVEDGFNEGVFTETDSRKRLLVVLSGIFEYGALVATCSKGSITGFDTLELRDFIYEKTIKGLK